MLASGLISETAQVCLEDTEHWTPIMDEFPTVLEEFSLASQVNPSRQRQAYFASHVDATTALIYTSQTKSLTLAAVLGFLIPGGGYWISGNYFSAILGFIFVGFLYGLAALFSGILGVIVGIVFGILAIIVHLLMLLGALARVRKFNEKLARQYGIPPV